MGWVLGRRAKVGGIERGIILELLGWEGRKALITLRVLARLSGLVLCTNFGDLVVTPNTF